MSAIETVLERLERVRKAGAGWYARCPAHDDRSPSLRIALGDDERVLLDCKVGCLTSDVIAAIGLEWRDLFEDSPPPRQPNAPKRVRRNSESSPPQLAPGSSFGRPVFEDPLAHVHGAFIRTNCAYDEHGNLTRYSLRPRP